MNCAICGAAIPALSRPALRKLGYCGCDISEPVKRRLIFCPNHGAVEVAKKIAELTAWV